MATIDLDAREEEIRARKQFLGKVIPPILELVKTRGTSTTPRSDSGVDRSVLDFGGFSFRVISNMRISFGFTREEFVREGVQVWHCHPPCGGLPAKEFLRLDVRWDTAGFGVGTCAVKFIAGEAPAERWTSALASVTERWKAIAEELDRISVARQRETLAFAARTERVRSESERLGFKD